MPSRESCSCDLSSREIILHSRELKVVLDPNRGAEVLSVQELSDGSELMWTTPWSARAQQILDGALSVGTDATSRFLAGFRGGWQTLCPNAGAPRTIHGAQQSFHGEVAVSAWTVVEQSAEHAKLSLELLSLPVRIEREVRVQGFSFSQQDRLINLSGQDLSFDYQQHPSFGADLLADSCLIETSARRYVNDPETTGTLAAGLTVTWPAATTVDDQPIQLDRLPAPGTRQLVFGWLQDFVDGVYRITNSRTGLAVTVAWDAKILPYAWIWQELNFSVDYPWFQRARVLAIEPSSTQTSGSSRRSVFCLAAGAEQVIPITLTVTPPTPARAAHFAYPAHITLSKE